MGRTVSLTYDRRWLSIARKQIVRYSTSYPLETVGLMPTYLDFSCISIMKQNLRFQIHGRKPWLASGKKCKSGWLGLIEVLIKSLYLIVLKLMVSLLSGVGGFESRDLLIMCEIQP